MGSPLILRLISWQRSQQAAMQAEYLENRKKPLLFTDRVAHDRPGSPLRSRAGHLGPSRQQARMACPRSVKTGRVSLDCRVEAIILMEQSRFAVRSSTSPCMSRYTAPVLARSAAEPAVPIDDPPPSKRLLPLPRRRWHGSPGQSPSPRATVIRQR